MISKLAPGMTNVNIVGKITSKESKRMVNTKYGKKPVCDALLRDETGEIKISLWGDQIEMIKEGEYVSIEGGYITEFQGEFHLSIPKRGLIQKQTC